jgi:very-short-patch-repair endonuclease
MTRWQSQSAFDAGIDDQAKTDASWKDVGSSPVYGGGAERSEAEGARMRAPKDTFDRARRLRREMTLPEVLLWQALRRKALGGLRFRKQHAMGRCVLDFYLPSARLAIEVDGQAHDMGDNPARDARRDAWLAGRGVKVLRVPAVDVLDQDRLEGVLQAIVEATRTKPRPKPPPSAARTPPP